jgi:hypothetical protein
METTNPPHTVCPAAEGLAGPPIGGPSVVCKIITREMSLVDYILESRNIEGMAHVTSRRKPTILRGFCCGDSHPRQPGDKRARAHYTFCPVWEAHEELERKRLMGEEGHRIFDAPEKPKILGQDPEVLGDLLGIDPAQVLAEEARFAAEHPTPASSGPGTQTLTGEQAMADIAGWEE